MIEETKYPIKYKTVRLPVETYGVSFGFQVKDEEAAKEAWRQLVKASGCSIVIDPVLLDEYDINSDKYVTVIKSSIVAHPNVPAPLVLSDEPNYIVFYIQEDFQ